MTVTSKRESILAYLKNTTLALIDGTGSFNLELSHITRNVKSPNEYESYEYPMVIIVDDFLTTYSPMLAKEYVTGSIAGLDDGMGIGLIGIVQVSRDSGTLDTGIVSREINKMHSDLIIAMHSDLTLGGNCETLSLKSNRNSLEWIEDGGLGIVFQEYRINYRFNPTASTPTT